MCKITTYAIGLSWCWVFASPVHASVLYAKVTASGSGDCSSWADACTLTTALSNANAGDQIRTQAGIYGPITLTSGYKPSAGSPEPKPARPRAILWPTRQSLMAGVLEP